MKPRCKLIWKGTWEKNRKEEDEAEEEAEDEAEAETVWMAVDPFRRQKKTRSSLVFVHPPTTTLLQGTVWVN